MVNTHSHTLTPSSSGPSGSRNINEHGGERYGRRNFPDILSESVSENSLGERSELLSDRVSEILSESVSENSLGERF